MIKEKFLVKGLALVIGVIMLFIMSMPLAVSARLTSTNLVYQGAFSFPEGDAWIYGGVALAYYPSGDPDGTDGYPGSLYATGNDQNDLVGEFTIPTPIITGNFDNLTKATVLQPLTDITGGLIETFTTCGDRSDRNLDGLAYIPEIDKIVWNLRDWFNVEACDNDSLGWSNLDLTGAQGVWHIGPRTSAEDELAEFHNGKTCDYLFKAPQSFADQYLGGRSLIAGNHREGGALGGSSGPTLYAVALPEAGNPPAAGQTLDALSLVYYRFRFGCCWDESGENVIPNPPPDACDYSGYRAFDNWSGGAWVGAGTNSAILIFGRKGVGDNCYGEQAECSNDPCNMYKGYHAYPYEPQILFYDPEDINDVIAGSKDPWTVLPYEVYNPQDVMFDPDCGVLGAVAYDETRGLIYAVEQIAGESGEPAVNVWNVNTVPITTTTATNQTTTTIDGETTTTTPIDDSTTTTGGGPCPSELLYREHSEEAETLRYVRDNILSHTPEGKEIIKLYYQWSPVIVKAIEEDEEFKGEMKEITDSILLLIEEVLD